MMTEFFSITSLFSFILNQIKLMSIEEFVLVIVLGGIGVCVELFEQIYGEQDE